MDPAPPVEGNWVSRRSWVETLLGEKEAAALLGISEEKLNEFVKNKLIPAYMIAGKYLRFKMGELKILKEMLKENAGLNEERIFNKAFSEVRGFERFKEVLRANDIYFIIGLGIVLILIFMFFR